MTQRKSSEEHAHARAIGRRIRAIRGDSSQSDFAAHFGVTRSALANYEMGRTRPPRALVEKISERAGIPADSIDCGPELADFEDEFKRLVGDGSEITDDEWAIVRLLRVSHPDDVLGVVRGILRGFEERSASLQLMDPNKAAIDLARLYTIADGKGSYQRGISGANVLQLAKAIALRTKPSEV